MSKRTLAFAAAAFLVVATGCGSGGKTSVPPSLSPRELPYHNLRSVEEYFDVIPFDYGPVSHIFQQDVGTFEAKHYQAALSNLKANGIEALSEGERRLILAVSWYAHWMQAETSSYRVLHINAYSETQGETLIEERCSLRDIAGQRLPSLVARRALAKAGSIEPSEASSSEPPADEVAQLYDFVDWGSEDEKVVLTEWQRRGDEWTCQRGTDSTRWVAEFMVRLLPDEAFLSAEPAGTETVEGRAAYKLRATPGSIGRHGEPTFYWLDMETLLPRQYEYRTDNENTVRITILEVNGEMDIQPPDVDVTCEEKDFEP